MRAALPWVMLACLIVAASPSKAESVQYFPVPDGAGPHDVAPAPDGTVWYTAQGAGALGRLDPKTGAAKQIPLSDRASSSAPMAQPG